MKLSQALSLPVVDAMLVPLRNGGAPACESTLFVF